MARRRRLIGDQSLQLAEDYATALKALEARSEAASTAALRRSLAGVMAELRRAYARYADAAEPNGRDPNGRLLQRSGAAVIRESSARLRSILEISQDFLSQAEIQGWQKRLEADLSEAEKLGVGLSRDLAALTSDDAALPFSGSNRPAIDAAVRNAGAYLAAEGARFREQISVITADAAARGWGPKRMEAQVRRALEGAKDPTGKTARMGLRQRAALIARTELATAYVQGQLNHGRRQGFDYVRWIAVSDERSCPFCLSRHGNIYPASSIVVPAHPRCRCVTSPIPAETMKMETGADRDDLLDQAFWEESKAEGVREYAKEKGMTAKKAAREINRYAKLPTVSERRRYPGALETLPPSVAIKAR